MLFRLNKTVVVLMIAVFGVVCAQNVYANQADLDAELDEYIEIFKANNFSKQRGVIEPLGWSGISDPRLFDVIRDKFKASMNGESKAELERASWYAKALALSGDLQYKDVLSNASTDAASKKVRKYAKIALERLDVYNEWNPVISQGVVDAPSGQLDQVRIKNTLASNSYPLIRLGAKRIFYAHSDDVELVGIAKELLLSEYKNVGKDKDHLDAVAWLIKAVSQSGDPVNKPALEEIIQNGTNKKVVKYAKKYINNF